MAARATRSASGAASSSDDASRPSDAMFAEPQEYRNEERMLTKMLDQLKNGRLPTELLPLLRNFSSAVMESTCSRCHLLMLSHDELGVIFDGLADPLQPVVAVALSSTCLGLRTPLRAALEVLQERHEKAAALGRKGGKILGTDLHGRAMLFMTCAELRDAELLDWNERGLTTDDMATLWLLLPWMPSLKNLYLWTNSLCDAGMQALCKGLGRGAAPSLGYLVCGDNDFGSAGAEALAAALSRGAMPNLGLLDLGDNSIGNQGVAALAPALKKLPALKVLDLGVDGIGDEGVASLLDNLGKDDFKALEELYLDRNLLTDKGCATIVAALKAGALPALKACDLMSCDGASEEACAAVDAALLQRLA